MARFSAPDSVGSKRRGSMSSSSSRSSKRSRTTGSARSTFGSAPQPNRNRRVKGSSVRDVNVILPSAKSAKKVQFKKRPPVKITKKFKDKIEKALEPKMPNGYYWNIFVDTFGTPTNDNEQYTQMLCKVGNPTQGQFFSPLQILDAASILWNGKLIVSNPAFGDTNMFAPTSTKVFCKDAWVDVKMRNNTQRSFTFIIYECAPKNDETLDPYVTWNRSITSEFANGVIKGGMANGSLYNSPTQFKEFNQAFKVAKRKFVLQPGQIYEFKVQGPQNYTYDFAKYTEESVPKNAQKMCRYLMSVHYVDLVTGSTAGAGRMKASAAQDLLDDIIVETTQHYRLGMPAQTGWKSSGSAPAAGPVPLGYVTDSKAYGPFQGAVTGATFSRYDELNPTVIETI